MEPREDPEDPEEDEEIHDLNWATGHPSQDEEANVNEILRFEEGLEERLMMELIEEDLAIMVLLATIEHTKYFHFGMN